MKDLEKLKIGDSVFCKKTFQSVETFFIKNKYYTITKISKLPPEISFENPIRFSSYEIKTELEAFNMWFKYEEFNKYFIPVNRKFKLQKLNEIL